jgi:hypothetical protein
VLQPRPSVIDIARQVCIKITTEKQSYDSNANGYINVYVDSGDGYVLETTANKFYNYTAIVLDKCYGYEGFKGLQVQGPNVNG